MTEYLVTAGLILPTASAEPIVDGAILVRDGVIDAVGAASDVTPHAGPAAVRWDFPSGTVLPGLIDCHVHLVFDASDDAVAALRAVDDRSLLLQMAGRARQLLNAGVTSVRDLGDRANLAVPVRDAIAAGVLPGPRILAAGSPLTVTGGHCWYLGGQADGEDQIRSVLRGNLQRGADLIKVMVTGGTITPAGPARWQQQFSTRDVALIVAEAHRFGRRVAAHVHGVSGIQAAVAAGVDTLEHSTFASEEGFATGPPEQRDELIDQIAASGIFVCPTLSGAIGERLTLIGGGVVRRLLDLVGQQHARGVRLIVGTDAGIPGVRFDRYPEALVWYAKAGLSPVAVLDAATVTAAQALGIADRTGQLAAGLSADLVVVGGDPRVDLGVLSRPNLVLAAGRPHVPDPVAPLPRSTIPAVARPIRAGASGWRVV